MHRPSAHYKVVVKLPRHFGWSAETIRGSTVSSLPAQHIDLQAVEHLQCRDDGSATLMLQESFLDKLLAASGQDSIFIKIHAADEARYPTELLRLPKATTLQAALGMTTKDTLGVIAKNTKLTPRFALRLKDLSKFAEFAKTHGLTDSSKCGRWRVAGLLPTSGSVLT